MISKDFNLTNALGHCGGASAQKWANLIKRTHKSIPRLANKKDPASCWDKRVKRGDE